MIYSFTQYRKVLNEAVSIDENLLGHLTHVKDLPHESPNHSLSSVQFIRQFHEMRQGIQSTSMKASLKHDGGASVHLIRNKDDKIGVSDKHRIERDIVAYSDEEINQHFGKHPEYAAALKILRSKGHEIVAPNRHVQGDILWTKGDSTSQISNNETTYTPNRITYNANSKAHTGIAIHTEVTNGIAHVPAESTVRQSKNIFVPKIEFKSSDHEYSDEDKSAVEHHLSQAETILRDHTTNHLTPEHIEHFTIYINRVARGSRKPSVEGYIKYLRSRGIEESKKLKTEKGQAKIKDKFESLATHVENNAEHFNRSIQLRHHLQSATDHVLEGINHPDLQTLIDDKSSRGEGIVLQKKDSEGRLRPVAKLVHSDTQYALGNNPRFPNKSAINESKEDNHVHAFYGKVNYATIGHKSAIDQMKESAKQSKSDTVVGLSNSPGPLGIEEKKSHAESILNHPVETGEEHTSNLFKFIANLHQRGYTHLTLHAGSDRAEEYQSVLNKYNNKPTKTGEILYNFKSIKVNQVGADREEGELSKHPRNMSDSELLKTAKSSRLIEYAKNGSEESRQNFYAYHKPLRLSHDTVENHWNKLKIAMKKMNENFILIINKYLQEKVLNIGFNSDHEHFREKYRNQIHDILRSSYERLIGGIPHKKSIMGYLDYEKIKK